MLFEDLNLKKETLEALKSMGYENPTEVQEKVIPLILSGTHVVVRSKTGTGKTAAFGIGIVERLAQGSAQKALVLAPTRELAVQVAKEIHAISIKYGFRVLVVYGGASINPQIDDLKRGVDILIATPGRLLDHCDRKTIDLSPFNIVVLDEADRMLDMGFRDQMDEIMEQVPDERTVILLSATLDEAIMKAASRYMKGEPNIIEVGEKAKPEAIYEEAIETSRSDKFHKLKEILREHSHTKALIFTSTKSFADRLAERLHNNGFHADCIMGDMSQAARERVLERFKEGRIKILVATDVAARGLHIDDVALIVNYDPAPDADTHLHRIGRTGRMGAEGKAISFKEKAETEAERFSDDHPDFAWMRRGDYPRSGPRSPRSPQSYSHSSPHSSRPSSHSSSYHRTGSRPTHSRPGTGIQNRRKPGPRR